MSTGMASRMVLVALLALATPGVRAQNAAPQGPKAALSELGWLAGVWVTADGAAKVEERWTPPEGGSMLAVSRTIKGGRLVAFEFLRIAERDGSLAYLAQPGGRHPPTVFPLAQIDATGVTFENPKHDFPKTIRYARRPDGTIEARIAGTPDQPTQAWIFKRAQP